MIRTVLLYTLFLASIVMISCTKDLQELKEQNYASFYAGQEDGMEIKIVNQRIKGGNFDPDEVELELPNTSNETIIVGSVSDPSGSLGFTYVYFTSVSENIKFLSVDKLDTSYAKVDTVIDTQFGEDSILINVYDTFLCQFQSDFTWSHEWLDENLEVYKYYKEKIKTPEKFDLSSATLGYRKNYAPYGHRSQSGPNTYTRVFEYYDVECRNLPEDIELYFLFEYSQDRSSRLGWIKVKYFGGNDMEVISWAIQS